MATPRKYVPMSEVLAQAALQAASGMAKKEDGEEVDMTDPYQRVKLFWDYVSGQRSEVLDFIITLPTFSFGFLLSASFATCC